MSETFNQRVQKVPWAEYQTAYGKAEGFGNRINALASENREIAMLASHDIWCSLCHQHAFVSSAAFPSYPFMVEILQEADDWLQVEILDILLGFSACLHPSTPFESEEDAIWRQQLYEDMRGDIPLFETFAKSCNEEIQQFAKDIVENLQAGTLVVPERREHLIIEKASSGWRSLLERMFRRSS
jgi:hypothetical protein